MIELEGFDDIKKVLNGLPAQLNHKVLQAANFEAAKPLVDKAKSLAPEGPTGRLIDSIGVTKESLKKVSEPGEVRVGPRRGRFKGFAGHLVERGTVQRETKKGINKGIMPKHPFMEPAFVSTKDLVLSRISVAIGQKLYSFMKRTIKNSK